MFTGGLLPGSTVEVRAEALEALARFWRRWLSGKATEKEMGVSTPILEVVTAEKEKEPSVPVSEVVAAGEEIEHPALAPEIVAEKEAEPLIPISEVVAADEEIEPPAPVSETVSLEADIVGHENVELPIVEPAFLVFSEEDMDPIVEESLLREDIAPENRGCCPSRQP